MTRENDDGKFGFSGLDRIEYLEPVQLTAMEPYIEQDEARAFLVHSLEGGRAIGGRSALVPFVAQDTCYELADVTLIVHYEDVQCHNQIPVSSSRV